MAGMEIKQDGRKITLNFEVDKDGKDSSTGKSTIMFTTRGFARIDSELSVNVTVIKRKPKQKK